MSGKPDCIHHLDLCPTCDGLRVTRLDRADGITSVRIDGGKGGTGGSFTLDGPVELYVGPIAADCSTKDE